MNKKNEIYDISAELTKEFGEVGSKKRDNAIEKAWDEYNAQIIDRRTGKITTIKNEYTNHLNKGE